MTQIMYWLLKYNGTSLDSFDVDTKSSYWYIWVYVCSTMIMEDHFCAMCRTFLWTFRGSTLTKSYVTRHGTTSQPQVVFSWSPSPLTLVCSNGEQLLTQTVLSESGLV